MSKLKINKKSLTAIILTLSLALNGCASKNDDSKGKISLSTKTGYTDFMPWKDIEDDDFVVLNVGDHNSVKTPFEQTKMSFCDKEDIELGVIISPNKFSNVDLYKDIDYAKSVIKDHKINLPVYLNIDSIMKTDKLTESEKTKYIETFLKRCSENNIYVGLYGHDTNLCQVERNCEIEGYDAFLIMDSNNIKYQGKYGIIQGLDQTIQQTTQLRNLIEKNRYNDPKRLEPSAFETVTSENSLIDIALKYGMSVDEIIDYNGLRNSKIKENDTIKVPIKIAKNNAPNVKITYNDLQNETLGCDLSSLQGENINWDLLSRNFSFVIIKGGTGLIEDKTFANNVKKSYENTLDVGVYFNNDITNQNTISEESFENQIQLFANHVVRQLQNNENVQERVNKPLLEEPTKEQKITYPVYLVLGNTKEEIKAKYSKEGLNNMLKIWNDTLKEAGYVPGFFINEECYDYVQEQVDSKLLSELEVWQTGGEQYNNKTDNIEVGDIEQIPNNQRNENASIIHCSSNVVNAGAGNFQGKIGANWCYKDFHHPQKEIIKPANLEEDFFEDKDNCRIDVALLGSSMALSFMGVYGVKKGLDQIKKSKENAEYIESRPVRQ